MNKRLLTAILGCSLLLLAITASVANADESVIVIINGYPKSVAIQGNKIVEVGTNEDVLKFKTDKAVVIDAKNGAVLPGFIDTHFHLMLGGLTYSDICIMAEVESVEDGVQTLKEYCQSHPGNETVLAIYSPYLNYTRQALDSVENGRPIIVFSYDMHAMYASTAVLEKGGILYPPPELQNNVLVDENGAATGELRESPGYKNIINQTGIAGAMLCHRIMEMSIDDPGLIPISEYKDEIKKLLYEVLDDLPKHGITGVSMADGDKDALALYEELEKEGRLTVRINMGFTIRPIDVKENTLDRIIIKDKPCSPDKMVCADLAKFFIDGVIETHTGYLILPYPGTNDTGLLYWTPEDFLTALTAVDDAGEYRVATHSIGDGAVRFALDGFEAAMYRDGAPDRDRRWSIEHIELINETDTARFKRSNITASMQPLHATLDDYYYAQIRDENKKRLFVWKEFEENGINLTFGSDWPVVEYDVLPAILYAYKTRNDQEKVFRDQRVSYETAIAGYTSNAAWLHHAENYRGKLEKGYLADVVVLSDQKVEEKTSVLYTICNGKITHSTPVPPASSSVPSSVHSGSSSSVNSASVIHPCIIILMALVMFMLRA